MEDKKLIKKCIRILIFIITIWIFWEIVENIFKNEIAFFDNCVYCYLLKFENPILTVILKMFTTIGSGFVLIPICILSYFILKDRLKAICISANFISIVLLNFILKNMFGRPRPDQYRLVKASGYSFPSGHSMVSMAFYGFFIYLIFKNVKNKKLKWIYSSLLSIMIIFIGISRIYLGVHYASDVVGGFIISISYLLIFTEIYKIISKNKVKNI